MTPREYWNCDNGVWEECATKHNNVIGAKYDDMLKDFERVLSDIGPRLGNRYDSVQKDKKEDCIMEIGRMRVIPALREGMTDFLIGNQGSI